MINCVSNEVMRISDKYTIDNFESSVSLMGKAAQVLFESVEWKEPIYIISGKGNNGGDGIALCNILKNKGYKVSLFLVDEKVSKDSEYYLDKLKEDKFNRIFSIKQCDYKGNTIVDCLLGTGFSGELKEPYSSIIDKINKSKAFKVSCDIPSGLNGDNGLTNKAVKADVTVAIQFIKSGEVLNSGKEYTGKLLFKDIGIELKGEGYKIVQEEDVNIFTKRSANANKSSYGKSTIIGGCAKYVGAIKLANMGVSALRCGGGLNTIATLNSLCKELSSVIYESTLYPMDEDNGCIKFNKEKLDNIIKSSKCLAVGMGIGENYLETLKIIGYIFENFQKPVLIDADGLNALSTKMEVLNGAKSKIILTPHPKEMSRLLGLDINKILENPIYYAKELANRYGIYVLLKGASSIITDGNIVYLVTNGGPELAKGGSGDTLSGVILGLLSQNFDILTSMYVGAYLCAKAASNAKEEFSEYGVLASDVAREIAKIIKNQQV